ncbi:MAG: NlpC/P60 family protein [bacterium]
MIHLCKRFSSSKTNGFEFRLTIKYLLVTFAILAVFNSACRKEPAVNLKNLQAVADRVGKQYVPDKRLDVYEIQLKSQGDQIVVTGEVLNRDLPAIVLDSLHQAAGEVALVDSIVVLPEAGVKDRAFGIVNISVANLRRQPKYQAELVTQSLLGTVVRIYKEKRGFYYVQNWDRYLGWVNKSSLVTTDYVSALKWQNAPQVMCVSNYGQVRSQSGASDDFLVDLVPGALLKRLEKGYNWYKVETPDGRVGYVDSDLVAEEESVRKMPPARENIIRTSKRFLGVPYLWGGTSAKGFDCSGFVQTVFKLNNLALPRDASQIAREGRNIQTGDHFENLLPGDLLFFGPDSSRITHCGIYMGEQFYIHSSGSVHVNSLDKTHPLFNEYRFKTFRKAKRIL